MATMLRDPKVLEYDILAIQEPWRNPFKETTHHPAKSAFHLCYPKEGEDGPARKTENRQSVLPLLRRVIEEYDQEEQIVLGDFNLHHELWGGSLHRPKDPEAEELAELIADQGLTNTLLPGTITYEEGDSSSTIDLCLLTVGLVDRIIRSGVDRSVEHDSDHLPITTVLDMRVAQIAKEPVRNWKALNKKVFQDVLTARLPQLRRPRTKTALDEYVKKVVEALWNAADAAVPKKLPCNKSKAGWSPECRDALKETKKLRHRYQQLHTEDSWEAYRIARNHKARTIRKALRDCHREKIEKAAESPGSLWRIAKWARNRDKPAPSITPELKNPATGQLAITPEEKTQLLKDTFFPTPPDASLEDISGIEYAEQIAVPPITSEEVEEAIRNTSPMKAPGPDGIPNMILREALPWIKIHLTRIYNHSLALGHCPEHFRESYTVVLRKPGKDNYTVPKAYRPIALLNTLGKIMDAIIAQRLGYLAEAHQLLPRTHIGGRRLKSTEHALHIIVEKIYEAWNEGKGKVVSLLLLDVSGAFDNVSHRRLLHNLRKRRIDEKIVRWVESFLKDRHTQILMDGYKSMQYKTSTGIPQGSPLSPILYLFYNADLVDANSSEDATTSVGYIDDVAIVAVGDTTEETCDLLRTALEKAQDWATKHASVFAPDKFQLTHFTRTRTRIDTQQTLQSPWGEIPPKPTCKYLGVTMDTALRWKPHIEEVRRKAMKTVAALQTLGNSRWGIGLHGMRKIYRGVAIPQIMYAGSIWSNADSYRKAYTQKTLETLQRIQVTAARAISGAFRATSRPALDVETHLLPVEQQIWKHNAETMGRILATRDIPEIDKYRDQNAAPSSRKRTYTSPLKKIYQALQEERDEDLDKQETIPPYITPPWWKGPVIRIAKDTESAEREHQVDIESGENNLRIYTDGSSINGHVGAAAVCLMTGETKKTYMGKDTVSTVYAAELQGIILALQIAEDDRERGNTRAKVIIYTDNQAAIRTSSKPQGRSGAYLLGEIAQQFQDFRTNSQRIEIRWIPAHTGIPGNEQADQAAKEATGWRAGNLPGQRAESRAELNDGRAAGKQKRGAERRLETHRSQQKECSNFTRA
ncbi:hypothetical protein NPX13_g11022 [Xylaria arbuscula]|uniref:Reverse transcriptase n=1 Tax=Xylaria arbuscula TaxID=114810 RepID=A0A9W8N3M0_9PEZI|nr:hypothetical protein NPX13_g11022 [Xylaria arbuscula]